MISLVAAKLIEISRPTLSTIVSSYVEKMETLPTRGSNLTDEEATSEVLPDASLQFPRWSILDPYTRRKWDSSGNCLLLPNKTATRLPSIYTNTRLDEKQCPSCVRAQAFIRKSYNSYNSVLAGSVRRTNIDRTILEIIIITRNVSRSFSVKTLFVRISIMFKLCVNLCCVRKILRHKRVHRFWTQIIYETD